MDKAVAVHTAYTAQASRSSKGHSVPAPDGASHKHPQDIVQQLDRYVIGQDRAKRDLAIAIHNHFLRLSKPEGVEIEIGGESELVQIQKSNILLMGPSGTGKTELIRTICRFLGVPLYVGDATRLTQAGYVGDDVESLLQGLVTEAGGDVEKAERGIIFLDEVDKIARKSGRTASGYRDIGGEGVQQSLLKMLEGHTFAIPRGMNSKVNINSATGETVSDTIDSTGILFVCAGSFAGITPIVERRLNHSASIGFGAKERVKCSERDLYAAITQEDVLEFGFIPEILGRLPVLTSTRELTEDELIEILTKPQNAITKQMRALFRLKGMDLTFTDDAIREIAKEAKRSETGARDLRRLVEKVLAPLHFSTSECTNIEVDVDRVRETFTSNQHSSV